MCGGSKDDLISEHISNLVPTSKTSCQSTLLITLMDEIRINS